MPTSSRPMSPRQLAELRGYVSPWTSVGRVTLLLGASLLGGAMLRSLVIRIAPDAHFLWWLVPSLGMAAGLFALGRRGSGGPALRERIRADLAGGVLNIDCIEVAEAIEVREQEDEGPAFFLKLTDGRVLVFSGQYLDRLKQRGFPWRIFELTEAPASKLIFQLKRLGAPIRPAFVREPFTFAEFKTYGGGKYQVLETDFESLKIKPASRRA